MSLTHSLIAFMGLILAQADAPRASQPLLDKLTAAHSESDAARREDDVWDAWLSESGPTVDIMMERGVTAMQTGDNALARDMFDRIILIDPDYAEVWHRRATLFYAAGRYDEAIADLEEALRREAGKNSRAMKCSAVRLLRDPRDRELFPPPPTPPWMETRERAAAQSICDTEENGESRS